MSDVTSFISSIENKTRKSDAFTLLPLFEQISGCKAYLSGSIICFGKYHYIYDSGREGDSSLIAFSPRKQNIVVYIMPGFNNFEILLTKLGKHKLGKSCLYINKLSDINIEILEKIADLSIELMKQKYPCELT